MTKQISHQSSAGKRKVTPAQVIFIVDRYLADNSFTQTLSLFRSEAGDLLPKINGNEGAKGLLALGNILDEYITLKEQRVMLALEKRRVEAALNGIQEVMRVYCSAAPTVPLLPPSPPLLLPHSAATTPTGSALFISPSNSPINGSPSGHSMHGAATPNYAQPHLLSPSSTTPNFFSTPMPNSSSISKRKASKSDACVPPAPKKSCSQSKKSCTEQTISSSMAGGYKENMLNIPTIQSASINNEIIKSSTSGSSVAKSLFKHQTWSGANSSSPTTPPLAFFSQVDKSISPEDLSFPASDAAISEFASTNCSVASSEADISSPLKQNGVYALEKSLQVTSPSKSSPNKVSKRDHAKGRLHFDEPDMPMNIEKTVAAGSSTPSTVRDLPGTFDYELPDLDFFNGEISLSELLIDCAPPDSIAEARHNTSNVCPETNQDFSAFNLSTVTGVLSEKDMNTSR